MLSVTEAQATILHQAQPLPPQVMPLTPEALGQVLAEDIVSDIDSPPYDKAMMDGYAIRSSDIPSHAHLSVIEEVTAGRLPQLSVGPGQATRIMTGAPVPAGADAVIPIERTRLLETDRVQIDATPTAGLHILPRAKEMARGQTVLPAGTLLRPQSFGLMATVGRSSAKVYPRPVVAVLPTGDEIVEACQVPGPGQIRNGNGPMLLAQTARAGGLPRYLGIARDTVEHLRSLIADGVNSPILVLSGGVSAGKLDLVPGVLQELGVQSHFHKVEMKPGKPMFFGTRDNTLAFGLPGNPVSSLVCFELFVRPAIRRLMGHPAPEARFVPVALAEDFRYSTDRPTYYPARLESGPNGWQVRPGPWFGSADLRALASANALVLFPRGDNQHQAGSLLPVLAIGD